MTLETDKTTMDVPSSAAGVSRWKSKIAVGSKVSEGEWWLLLEASAARRPGRARCGTRPLRPPAAPAAAAD